MGGLSSASFDWMCGCAGAQAPVRGDISSGSLTSPLSWFPCLNPASPPAPPLCSPRLQLGKLELPSSLLQSGAYLSPYLCLFSLTSMGTGAGVIKSRNNLLRQSQL